MCIRDSLRTLERDLRNVVFGQDAAIEALGKAIKLSLIHISSTHL